MKKYKTESIDEIINTQAKDEEFNILFYAEEINQVIEINKNSPKEHLEYFKNFYNKYK